jgi:hypothetical protein
LNIKFNTNGTQNFAFASFFVGKLDSADSAKFEITAPTTPVISGLKPQLQAFDIQGRNLILLSAGNVEIYSTKGRRAALFSTRESGETISLKNLPAGVYLAVLRKPGGLLYTKTVYLK